MDYSLLLCLHERVFAEYIVGEMINGEVDVTN